CGINDRGRPDTTAWAAVSGRQCARTIQRLDLAVNGTCVNLPSVRLGRPGGGNGLVYGPTASLRKVT
ncbi:MAG: hypothetical protein ACYC1C_20490, partial [Chloroflexota bacterium]